MNVVVLEEIVLELIRYFENIFILNTHVFPAPL
jgi:hypothetical protein